MDVVGIRDHSITEAHNARKSWMQIKPARPRSSRNERASSNRYGRPGEWLHPSKRIFYFFPPGIPFMPQPRTQTGISLRSAELSPLVVIILHASRLKPDPEKARPHLMRGVKQLSSTAERGWAEIMLNQELKRDITQPDLIALQLSDSNVRNPAAAHSVTNVRDHRIISKQFRFMFAIISRARPASASAWPSA